MPSKEERFKITGFYTVAEYIAYEKGREHEQQNMMNHIEKFEFKGGSPFAVLMMKKINEYLENKK